MGDATPYSSFVSRAKDELLKTRNEVVLVQEKYSNVLSYFGEDPELNSQDFFKTLHSFCQAFKEATEELEAIEEQERTKARRDEEAEKRKKLLAEKRNKAMSSPQIEAAAGSNDNNVGILHKPEDGGKQSEDDSLSPETGRMTLFLEGARRMHNATGESDSEGNDGSTSDSSNSNFTSDDEESATNRPRLVEFQNKAAVIRASLATNADATSPQSFAVNNDTETLLAFRQRALSSGTLSDDESNDGSSQQSDQSFKFKAFRRERRSMIHQNKAYTNKMPNLHKIRDMLRKEEEKKTSAPTSEKKPIKLNAPPPQSDSNGRLQPPVAVRRASSLPSALATPRRTSLTQKTDWFSANPGTSNSSPDSPISRMRRSSAKVIYKAATADDDDGDGDISGLSE